LEGVRTLGAFNVHSDKSTLPGPIGRKRESSAVRTPAWCANLMAIFGGPRFAAVGITSFPPITMKSPARHHSRRAHRNSDRHHHHREAMANAQ
jgi:hypothetical protein